MSEPHGFSLEAAASKLQGVERQLDKWGLDGQDHTEQLMGAQEGLLDVINGAGQELFQLRAESPASTISGKEIKREELSPSDQVTQLKMKQLQNCLAYAKQLEAKVEVMQAGLSLSRVEKQVADAGPLAGRTLNQALATADQKELAHFIIAIKSTSVAKVFDERVADGMKPEAAALKLIVQLKSGVLRDVATPDKEKLLASAARLEAVSSLSNTLEHLSRSGLGTTPLDQDTVQNLQQARLALQEHAKTEPTLQPLLQLLEEKLEEVAQVLDRSATRLASALGDADTLAILSSIETSDGPDPASDGPEAKKWFAALSKLHWEVSNPLEQSLGTAAAGQALLDILDDEGHPQYAEINERLGDKREMLQKMVDNSQPIESWAEGRKAYEFQVNNPGEAFEVRMDYLQEIRERAQTENDSQFDIAIAGAGPGGLISTIVALVKGDNPTLIEARKGFTRDNMVKLALRDMAPNILPLFEMLGVRLPLLQAKAIDSGMSKQTSMHVAIKDLQSALQTVADAVAGSATYREIGLVSDVVVGARGDGDPISAGLVVKPGQKGRGEGPAHFVPGAVIVDGTGRGQIAEMMQIGKKAMAGKQTMMAAVLKKGVKPPDKDGFGMDEGPLPFSVPLQTPNADYFLLQTDLDTEKQLSSIYRQKRGAQLGAIGLKSLVDDLSKSWTESKALQLEARLSREVVAALPEAPKRRQQALLKAATQQMKVLKKREKKQAKKLETVMLGQLSVQLEKKVSKKDIVAISPFDVQISQADEPSTTIGESIVVYGGDVAASPDPKAGGGAHRSQAGALPLAGLIDGLHSRPIQRQKVRAEYNVATQAQMDQLTGKSVGSRGQVAGRDPELKLAYAAKVGVSEGWINEGDVLILTRISHKLQHDQPLSEEDLLDLQPVQANLSAHTPVPMRAEYQILNDILEQALAA